MFRLLVSALVGIVVVYFFYSTTKSQAQIEYVPAVVVTKNVAQNEVLNDSNLEIRNVPVSAVPENALKSIPKGAFAAKPLFKGEYLLSPMVSNEKVFIVLPDHRLVSIPVQLDTTANIDEGDFVSIFWYYEDEELVKSEMLLDKIRVHSVRNDTGRVISGDPGLVKSQITGSFFVPAVVEVYATPEQINILNIAANAGTLRLSKYLPVSKPIQEKPKAELREGEIGQVGREVIYEPIQAKRDNNND
ncbi:MAG: hypothetical protein H0Z35_07955 [Thermoanaerobacteraceae bacterium]|nr:hypothetical protein [Thermoanaerobacteraceae bacterium]